MCEGSRGLLSESLFISDRAAQLNIPVGDLVLPGLMLDLLGVLGPVSLVSLRLLSLVLPSFSTELLRFLQGMVLRLHL